MNVWQYGALSATILAAVVGNALLQREQFYLACVYLTNSNANILVLYNTALFSTFMFGKLIRRVFFGQLRPIEVEHLYEEGWYSFTETLLALSMFRNEFDATFVAWFTWLLFLKAFHLLTQDRVDYMEQTPILSDGFHVRMVSFLFLLGMADLTCIMYAAVSVMQRGPSMYLLFGFEFTVLLTSMITSLCKYVFNCIDLASDQPWDRKSMYIFYLELVMDGVRLMAYVVYFGILMTYYSVPLYILRDVYVTFRSFMKRIHDMAQYRRATANMHEMYLDATAEEIAAGDGMCIICRDELAQAKKLPCGHMFHMHCLRSWLERQQLCPTCRRPVLQLQGRSAASRSQPPPVVTQPAVHVPTPPLTQPQPQPQPLSQPQPLHGTSPLDPGAVDEERARLVVRLAQIQAMHATVDAMLTQLANHTKANSTPRPSYQSDGKRQENSHKD